MLVGKMSITETRPEEFDLIADLYKTHRDTHDHGFIRVLLYGDEAARSLGLGYRPIGTAPFMSFRLARTLANLAD